MRVAGIDPGTRTFDIVVVEDDRVVVEMSFDTHRVAEKPGILLESLSKIDVDYIIAPSGYGVPVTRGSEILDPRRFAVEVLLLITEKDLEKGRLEREIGIWVYDALAKVVESLVEKRGERVFFLPGVIHLRTIPRYRKINKVDMGTVDKLASTFIAIYKYAVENNVDYEDVDIVVVEMGYGYNAAIAVEKGRVVDGVGGSYASMGTLTAGALDLEVVVNTGTWMRWDVFHGGLFRVLGVYSLDEIAEKYSKSIEPYYSAFNAYVENIVKDIRRVLVSTPRAEAVVLTGRHARNNTLRKAISEKITDLELIESSGLRGSSISKEAAQGYAAIGSGILGGFFSDLVEHMDIEKACGTSVDYLVHPRTSIFVERVKKAYLESVKEPRLCIGD